MSQKQSEGNGMLNPTITKIIDPEAIADAIRQMHPHGASGLQVDRDTATMVPRESDPGIFEMVRNAFCNPCTMH